MAVLGGGALGRLRSGLARRTVLLGPLDMGYLSYRPIVSVRPPATTTWWPSPSPTTMCACTTRTATRARCCRWTTSSSRGGPRASTGG